MLKLQMDFNYKLVKISNNHTDTDQLQHNHGQQKQRLDQHLPRFLVLLATIILVLLLSLDTATSQLLKHTIPTTPNKLHHILLLKKMMDSCAL